MFTSMEFVMIVNNTSSLEYDSVEIFAYVIRGVDISV